MNLANMKKLRTRVRSRKNPVKFNMGNWFAHNLDNNRRTPENLLETVETHACGTVACLAGHAAIIYLQENDGKLPQDILEGGDWIRRLAQHYLGLRDYEADALFHGHWWIHYYKKPLKEISKAEAIRELTRLIWDG